MFLVKSVYASCPVCIVTVGGGLFIAKKLGIDDTLVSIWISGLNTAVAFYTANWIYKKREKHHHTRTLWWKIVESALVWSALLYGTSLWYFAYTNELFHANNKIWGADKIITGMTAGLVAFFIAIFIDKYLRGKNNGKVYFPYQRVVIPVLLLSVATALFQFALSN